MSRLRFNAVATPSVPSAGKVELFVDIADNKKIKAIDGSGFVSILSSDGFRDKNLLTNGDFGIAQRQVPTTLTTYVALTGGRQYSFDRWFHSMPVTTTMTIQQVSNLAGAEVGLQAPQYAKYKPAVAVCKLVIGQVIENADCAHLLGKKVRVQVVMRYAITTGMQAMRLGLAQVTGAGTVDSIGARTANAFISAFGATGVDPTLTAANNMSYIVPLLCETSGGGGATATINGSGVDCLLATSFQRFSATFLIPATAKNLCVLLWSNNAAVAIADEIHLSEYGLYAGEEIRDWYIKAQTVDIIWCNRYYQKSFAPLIAPAQSAGLIGAINGICSLAGAVALAGRCWWNLPIQLFRTPTSADITLYNPSAANAVMRHPYIATPIDMGVTALTANLSAKQIEVAATGVATTLVGSVCAIHAAVDVDI